MFSLNSDKIFPFFFFFFWLAWLNHGTQDLDHHEDDVAAQIAPASVPFWQKDRRHPEHQEFDLPTAYIVLQPH